jgi:uncharacterized membrane protein
MRPYPPLGWGICIMATKIRSSGGAPDLVKWSFAALMVISVVVVLWIDERFWLNPADPHWKHIAPVRTLLPIHGLAGVTALVAGALQMSSRIRRDHIPLHRKLGKIYIAAVCISAPIAIFMGSSTLEPATMRVEQIFQGGLWLFSALVAWACIRSGQMPLHKAWMMRSYAFTLVFVLSRLPDVIFSSYTDQGIADMLWSLTVFAALSPEIILTATSLLRIRNAKARHAAR